MSCSTLDMEYFEYAGACHATLWTCNTVVWLCNAFDLAIIGYASQCHCYALDNTLDMEVDRIDPHFMILRVKITLEDFGNKPPNSLDQAFGGALGQVPEKERET